MPEMLTAMDWAVLAAVAFMVGLAKAGIHGTTLLSVPLLALLFGGKQSSGLMLPMLLTADLFAVHYYHRHANWHYLFKLFPSAAIGVLLGTWVGDKIDDGLFMQIMAVTVFVCILLMLWLERNKSKIPDYTWFAILMGMLGGFTTMVGNLAGTFMAVYLLSMRLPKNVFIGTAAWFFLIINLFKLPFHIFVWESISVNTLTVNLWVLPLIIIGVYTGISLVKLISDAQYRYFVMAMTIIAAIPLLFR